MTLNLHLHLALLVDHGHVLLQLLAGLFEGVGERGALAGQESARGDDHLRLEGRTGRNRGNLDGGHGGLLLLLAWSGHGCGGIVDGTVGGGALLNLGAGQGRLAHHGGEAFLGSGQIGTGVECLAAVKRSGNRSESRSGGSGNRGGLGEGGSRREGIGAVIEILEFAEKRFINAIVG